MRIAIPIILGVLSACGGGGGGGSSSPTPAVNYQGVVTSVPAPNYTATEENTVATILTAFRQGNGSGLLAQNSKLDQVATSHTAYLVNNSLVSDNAYLTSAINGELGAHYEDPSKSGYTGSTPQTRATAAGYAGTVTEVVTIGAADALGCFSSQADSVYHLIDLMSPFMDAGISFNEGDGTGSVCAIELGVSNDTLGQLPTAGNEVVYPYDQQTSVGPTYYNQAEAPNPAPDLSQAGQPVVISLYNLANTSLSASDIVIQNYTLMPSGGSALSARILAKSGVTSTGPTLTIDTKISKPGFVVLLPVAPLAPNTVYNVSFAGTVKGSVESKNWSFTTGTLN